MPEIYTLQFDQGRIMFTPFTEEVPQSVLESKFNPDSADKGLNVVCRMGDPDLVQCIVYKKQDLPGGYFSLHDKNGLLFAAISQTNLIFALACGFFGEMVANARYGVDIFENMEEPDD